MQLRLPALLSWYRVRVSIAVPALALCLFASVGRAISVTPTAFTFNGIGGGATLGGEWGWEFSTANPITVTELGVWDQGGDGLSGSHQVGIFTTDGTLEGSGTVASGTTDPLTGSFRYVNLSNPFTLDAGTYFIVALYVSDDGLSYLDYGSVHSGLTYVGSARNSSATSLVLPTAYSVTQGQYSYFGPNFEFTAASATPEPASLLTMGTGLLAVAGLLRRRHGRKGAAA
jgi:hypothetical protein